MIHAFTTKIYHQPLVPKAKSAALLNQCLEDIENLLASDHQGHQWSKKNYPLGYTSYGSVDQLHRLFPSFQMVEKKLQIHLGKYLKSLNYAATINDFELSHCWANVMPQGSQHTSHIHPLSVFSGTLYLQLPKGSSPIKFEDPRLGLFMNSPIPKNNADHSSLRFLSLKPKIFDVVMFESWLRHEVPVNSTNDPRISISFNYGWKNSSS